MPSPNSLTFASTAFCISSNFAGSVSVINFSVLSTAVLTAVPTASAAFIAASEAPFAAAAVFSAVAVAASPIALAAFAASPSAVVIASLAAFIDCSQAALICALVSSLINSFFNNSSIA